MAEYWQCGKSLTECLKLLLDKQIHDVTFRLKYEHADDSEPVYHYALKTVLYARSPVFFTMFRGALAEESSDIEITDIEPAAFYEILRYIYTDNSTITEKNVFHILYGANKYMLTGLSHLCRAFVKTLISEKSVAEILNQSVAIGDLELQETSLKILGLCGEGALQACSFLDMSKQSLQLVLQSSQCSATELQLFQACVRWAKKRCEEKDIEESTGNMKKILGDMLNEIRFPTMTANGIAEVAETGLLPDKQCSQLFFHIAKRDVKKTPPFDFSLIPREMYRTMTMTTSKKYPYQREYVVLKRATFFIEDKTTHMYNVNLKYKVNLMLKSGNHQNKYTVVSDLPHVTVDFYGVLLQNNACTVDIVTEVNTFSHSFHFSVSSNRNCLTLERLESPFSRNDTNMVLDVEVVVAKRE